MTSKDTSNFLIAEAQLALDEVLSLFILIDW